MAGCNSCTIAGCNSCTIAGCSSCTMAGCNSCTIAGCNSCTMAGCSSCTYVHILAVYCMLIPHLYDRCTVSFRGQGTFTLVLLFLLTSLAIFITTPSLLGF